MIINENDYLAHYGRKGMKWYQHIFGDEDSIKIRRAKAAAAKASRGEKTKTAGKAVTLAALGAIGGQKLGKKLSVDAAFRNAYDYTIHIGEKVVSGYRDYPTLGEAFKARDIGACAGLSAGATLAVLGYTGYKLYKKYHQTEKDRK